jgi:hypothetical protein
MIQLAAQMAERTGMPSPYLEDWKLPKSTPVSVMRAIEDTAIMADAQCALWATRLRCLADKMMKQNTELSSGTH